LSQQRQRPNVLLIFTDQHRLSALGCYGETPCQTPNIDRLAGEGVQFETAYTCCPVCSPARATIMTGLYPHGHGVISNVQNLGCNVNELADRPGLLSRRLGAAGYRLGYSGKWHLGTNLKTAFGAPNTPSYPRDVGFEGQNFQGHGGGGFRYPEYRAYLEENGFEHKLTSESHVAWHQGVLDGPEESTVPYFLAQHTIDLMDRFRAVEEPFFIWHNFWGPHAPYFATQEYYDLYRDVEIPRWPNFEWAEADTNRPHQVKLHPRAGELPWDDWAESIRHYYAFTTMIDRQIGRMLDHLEATGLAENTLVIFTSDHGETLGSHGGLTDKGWHHFEEIQRIGMIVKAPPATGLSLSPGTVRPEWTSLVDIYPTILDVAGAEYDPDVLHGSSLVPVLEGRAEGWRDAAFVEFHGVNHLTTNMMTCRQGDLKYGWNASSVDELYDLAVDPHETVNRIDGPAYVTRLREIRERLDRFMDETRYPARHEFRRRCIAQTV